MRRRFGQALRLGVSGSEVCLLRTSRWGASAGAPELLGRAPLVAAGLVQGGPGALSADFSANLSADLPMDLPTALPAALASLLADASYAGWPLSVVLADDLLRLWQVTPPDGVARLADLQGAAALRFQTLYGESAAQWRMMASWDNRRPFFAAAAPQALLAALEQGAATQRLTLVAVVPHFIGAWNRWRRALQAGAWFGVVHDGLLSLGAVEAGQLRAVRILPLPVETAQQAGADHHWLSLGVGREALLLGLAAPSLLQLCGQVPAQWHRPAANAAGLPTTLSAALTVTVLDQALQVAAAGMPPAGLLALQGGGR